MLKKVLIAVLVLLAGILIFAATRPNEFRVQRSTTIQARPEKVQAFIQDFHQWGAWSPYEKMDPEMKRTFSGPASGKGSVYAWEGNSKAGAGRMEILDVVPGSKVKIQLDFTKPMEGHNTAEFTTEPQGDSTNVTWAMYGPSPYVAKLAGMFLNMDAMIGKDFETGLANLKAVTEK
jgi:uncharacterized protein YndB with AHSA1/START domain